MAISRFLHRLKNLGVRDDQPQLNAAQLAALAKNVPLIYLILAVNTVMMTHFYIGRAPSLLTVVVPSLLCGACVIRGIIWFQRRSRPPSAIPAAAGRALRRITVLAIVIAILFISWALALYPYGDAITRIFFAFFVACTTLGCGLCLMHLPVAAFLLIGIVMGPFLVIFVASGQDMLVSVAINLTVIYVIIVYVLMAYFENFEAMVLSQSDLRSQNTEIARLHQETSRIEVRRQSDRQTDLDRIAEAFTRSIEAVTTVLGDVSTHNAAQCQDVATCSDLALARLQQVILSSGSADQALNSVADAVASLFEAIAAIRRRTGDAAAISATVEARTGSADRAMETLDTTVKQIDTISALIKTIAGQINLIALNATIEAARAGDAGRGFAVVASEIKILASQTERATDDIGLHVGNVKVASVAAHSSVAAMKTAFLELRGVTDEIANALEVQTQMTGNIQGFVATTVDAAAIMRGNLADMSNTAGRTQESARAMLDQCAVLGTETNVLAREVKNFIGFIKAA